MIIRARGVFNLEVQKKVKRVKGQDIRNSLRKMSHRGERIFLLVVDVGIGILVNVLLDKEFASDASSQTILHMSVRQQH